MAARPVGLHHTGKYFVPFRCSPVIQFINQVLHLLFLRHSGEGRNPVSFSGSRQSRGLPYGNYTSRTTPYPRRFSQKKKGPVTANGYRASYQYGTEGRTRTGMGCPTDTSSLRVYQFHHSGNPYFQIIYHKLLLPL